jgi:hypothetical protein
VNAASLDHHKVLVAAVVSSFACRPGAAGLVGVICYSSRVGIERRKKLYRRERGTNVWHLLPECSAWPVWNFVERLAPGAGIICPECLQHHPEIPKRRKADFKKAH